MWEASLLVTFREKWTRDLALLTTWPEARQKSSRVLLMRDSCAGDVPLKRIKSSAKKRWDKGTPPRPSLMVSQRPACTCRWMVWESLSMHKTKMYGDKGSPCRIPRVGVNGSDGVPFHRMCIRGVDMQCMIRLVRCGGKCVLYETPAKFIKGLFKVDFDC